MCALLFVVFRLLVHCCVFTVDVCLQVFALSLLFFGFKVCLCVDVCCLMFVDCCFHSVVIKLLGVVWFLEPRLSDVCYVLRGECRRLFVVCCSLCAVVWSVCVCVLFAVCCLLFVVFPFVVFSSTMCV